MVKRKKKTDEPTETPEPLAEPEVEVDSPIERVVTRVLNSELQALQAKAHKRWAEGESLTGELGSPGTGTYASAIKAGFAGHVGEWVAFVLQKPKETEKLTDENS